MLIHFQYLHSLLMLKKSQNSTEGQGASQNDRLIQVEMALEALRNVIKNNPGMILSLIDWFRWKWRKKHLEMSSKIIQVWSYLCKQNEKSRTLKNKTKKQRLGLVNVLNILCHLATSSLLLDWSCRRTRRRFVIWQALLPTLYEMCVVCMYIYFTMCCYVTGVEIQCIGHLRYNVLLCYRCRDPVNWTFTLQCVAMLQVYRSSVLDI